MAEEEKMENAPDPGKQSRFLRALDNFWYHYKWHTLIALFFAVVLIVCLVQCVSREKTDLTVSFGGAATLSEAEQNALGAALEAVVGIDVDRKGAVRSEGTRAQLHPGIVVPVHQGYGALLVGQESDIEVSPLLLYKELVFRHTELVGGEDLVIVLVTG